MITTKNVNMQTPAYTITIGEIIGEFGKAKTRKDKKEVLEKHKDNEVLGHLLRGTFDPRVQWTITEQPDYVKDVETPEGAEANTLYQEMPNCSIFVKGHPASAKLKPQRMKELLIQILESLGDSEAQLYMQMLKKKSKVKGLTSKLVLEVFPNMYKEGA
tara:strand:- start:143 stop:619 length:477 start_codon:yes stop_codon:yes gene_type:complete